MEKSQKIPKKGKKPAPAKSIHRIRHSKDDKAKAARYYIMGLNLFEISVLLGNTPTRTLEKWQLSGKWTSLKNCKNIMDQVLQLHESGKTRKEIAGLVDRDESTIYRWIKKAKLEREKMEG